MTKTPNWIRSHCIGKGSFGTVNLAVNKSDGAMFAVKSIDRNNLLVSEYLENEIRILKSLSSDYVVKYLGDDYTKEENCLVMYRNLHMEYMPGGTVADLDIKDDVMIRSYTRCIVSALGYIHSRNIIHCDVKGKNVLVGVGPGVAKLADFGSAVEMGDPVIGTRGSPLWMAPEVVRREYQGPESDVWSLGCTVIEMVTGMPAWQDRGVDTLFQIGYSDELPKLQAQVSDELRDFLSKCLKRDRAERWSCDELLQHPFLLSCSAPREKELSPRCVFDWSDSNFSDNNASEIEVNVNSDSSYLRQRISQLSSNSTANWDSDGWELVRNVVVVNSQGSEFEFVEDETTVTSEYSDSTENNDEESTISRSERTIREYWDSNWSFDNDDRCTNNHAQSTSSWWSTRDMDHYYSCCMFGSFNKLLLFNPMSSDTFIIKFCFCLILVLFEFMFSYLLFTNNFSNEDLN
ncbi:mitogen-activated protein kinase kinase kinase 17-like [Bidens hawaiensis]|uniref:mitogen-activated protein kinase kinase kinase 17-like n=1 Tax=Bidens hawaiensis TaxID=980011 RepID=UPI00404974CC